MSKYLSNAEFRAYVRDGSRVRYSAPMSASDAHRLAASRSFRAAAADQCSFPEVGVARIVRGRATGGPQRPAAGR